MTALDHFLLQFLQASAGCLAVGAVVWLLSAFVRRVPGLALQRSTWLLAQLTIALAFFAILLPHSERLRLVPPIEIDNAGRAGAQPAALSIPPSAWSNDAGAAPAPAPARSWMAHAARAWLVAYLLGLAYTALRLWQARRLMGALARAGTPIGRIGGLDVLEIDAPISPMLFGLFSPRLLLPRHLRSFDPLQQELIVQHELTHLRRRDLHWMSAGLVLETLLWFNPVMRLLRTRLSWAQELGCDRDVLAGRPATERKAYASALVAQLRMQHGRLDAALAFGGVSGTTVAARICLIRAPMAGARSRHARVAALAVLSLVFAGSLTLQPALAWRGAPAPVAPLSCTAIIDAASGASLVHEGQCGQRVTPASTFNIPISLMGYDSGVLIDEHAPSLPFKAGDPDWIPSWRQATNPSSWLGNSVLWYAQRITARVGAARFQRYVQQFDYGNQDVSGDAGKDNGLTMSWVASSLAISPLEQVAFLRKVVKRQLALSPHAYSMTARIMVADTLPNGWLVHGKTGTAPYVGADGKDHDTHQYGWYVGWASKGGRTVTFARLVLQQRQGDSHAGPLLKQAFLSELPGRLDAL